MATIAVDRQRPYALSAAAWTAMALSGVLLLYGNGTSLFSDAARERFLLWSNLGFVALLLLWALRSHRMSALELGLDQRRARASALVGAAISLVVVVPPLLFILLAPLFNGGAVQDGEITGRSGAGLGFFLLVRQPLGTALFEELAFRGVLYASWARAGGNRLAIIASSAVCALWHIVITPSTVAESGFVDRGPAVAIGVAVSLIGLFVGGLIFAYLRWRTQSIAAAVVAHWLIVAIMVIAVWAMA
jgi:tRNA pseudouridine32 synthase/23S rRNA pseudouridine746 synthase